LPRNSACSGTVSSCTAGARNCCRSIARNHICKPGAAVAICKLLSRAKQPAAAVITGCLLFFCRAHQGLQLLLCTTSTAKAPSSLASWQPWRPSKHVQTPPSSPPGVCPVWQHWLRWCRPTGSVRARAGGCGCRRRLRVHYAVNVASSQHLTTRSLTLLSSWHHGNAGDNFCMCRPPLGRASVCPVWQHWLRRSRPTGSVRVAAGGCGCRRRLREHYAVNAVNMASSRRT
jgi:hypothetical protein